MFWRSEEGWVTYWGHSFKWTPDHMSSEQLEPLAFTYDVLASEALDRLDELCPPERPPSPEEQPSTPSEPRAQDASSSEKEKPKKPRLQRDYYELLKENAHRDDKLRELWDQVNTVPEWVDWEQIERGQKVFYRYAGAVVVALTFQSLVGGMGGRRVVETLSRTGGFGASVARRRLLETFQHLLQATASLPAIQPGGAGSAASVRVRLLHAAVRRRILRLAAARPGYYSVAEHGVPISDLDSLGTVTAFCGTPLWIGLPRQGVRATPAEEADYVALWRYVAHVLGAPSRHLATPRAARAAMESLLASELRPTPTGRVLANNVLTGLAGQPPVYASRAFLAAEAHWLNGRALASALGIARPPVYYTALVAGQCVFFALLALAARRLPAALWDDQGRIAARRRLLYAVTVDKTELGALGGEAAFDFKYIPSLEAPATELGDHGERRWRRGVPRGVEWRNLKYLAGAGAVAGVLAWAGIRCVSAVCGLLWQ